MPAEELYHALLVPGTKHRSLQARNQYRHQNKPNRVTTVSINHLERQLNLARSTGGLADLSKARAIDDVGGQAHVHDVEAVSYTHLDVYKRQLQIRN